jgi:alkaline phosphatase
MIEGSNIDKRAHQNKFEGMMAELKDFDQTVGIVLDWASKHPGTLVVITADHNTGGFMITGGNQATGEVSGSYSTMGHDGVTVPVYAYGAGSPLFTGVYENTAIHDKISALMHGKATSAPTE